MNESTTMVDALEAGLELDRMYLEAINSQAETLHLTLLAVCILGIFQAVIYLKLNRIEGKISQGDEG